MKDVMEALIKREAERKIPVLWLEIDYELMTLHDAIVAKDDYQKKKAKYRLKRLRNELVNCLDKTK